MTSFIADGLCLLLVVSVQEYEIFLESIVLALETQETPSNRIFVHTLDDVFPLPISHQHPMQQGDCVERSLRKLEGGELGDQGSKLSTR
ncbi:hypothetical protein PF005_g19037 [Phytophthora fragariae]|uniref:Uncharacterized protein n=1 Tax=Phytophthora fragariae TaxID=53985 RepID=A0A6A4CK42_9STRA|nr:hypothetical protein PF009_g20047 [Phytophthora fragariae]KAE8995207.1 hypothetical protein PF011_g16424 [Phytophthora fragariae]KAE9091339.1 hypothetical protein PF007_g18915 [Phytophthora fragariae]KAE9093818.1 hypothetical protein PF010_g17338 [Phytophthora fragariae]KAE9117066.1 hypothetical protein PF006_g18896 [Phytophthora fragariae]